MKMSDYKVVSPNTMSFVTAHYLNFNNTPPPPELKYEYPKVTNIHAIINPFTD